MEDYICGSSNGVNVYKPLGGGEYWFTLYIDAIEGAVCDDFTGQFDSRTLPQKYIDENSDPIEWVLAAINDGFDFRIIEISCITCEESKPPKEYPKEYDEDGYEKF